MFKTEIMIAFNKRLTADVAERFTSDYALADAELAAESKALVKHMRRYVLRQFGPRCGEFESGCPVCEMWARHDSLKSYICD